MTTQEIINGLQNVLDYCRYHQDAPALREAIEMLKCSEIPNSSNERTDKRTGTHACDCISRQQAIDALAKMMPSLMSADGSHPADEEIFKAQEIFADCIESIEILPSAQPEIVRCKDCKYWREGDAYSYCDKLFNMGVLDVYDYMASDDDFCSYAERREDG